MPSCLKKFKNSIAVLVFSRSAKAEALVLKKSINQDRVNVDKLANLLVKRVKKITGKCAYPVYFSNELNQVGETFGHKYYNAIAEIFSKGYEGVITIGGDCPALNHHDINLAADLLECQDMVLGPATDGGIYLLGLRKERFLKGVLNNLPWQSENLFHEINKRGAKHDVLLEIKADIDNQSAFNDILGDTEIPLHLKILLFKCWLRVLFIEYTTNYKSQIRILWKCNELRGPPTNFGTSKMSVTN